MPSLVESTIKLDFVMSSPDEQLGPLTFSLFILVLRVNM